MRGSSASGYRYYRDPAADQGRDCDQLQVRAQEAEDALGNLLRELTLPSTWQEEILAQVEGNCSKPENGVTREQIEGRLKRLKQLFVLGDLSETEYRAERDKLRAKLADLTPPELPDLQRAAEPLEDFGTIWDGATPKERKQIVHTLLEAVYLDSGDDGPLVAVEPRAEFAPLFEMMGVGDGEDSEVASRIPILAPGENIAEALWHRSSITTTPVSACQSMPHVPS
jgi:hypothetical protein